ncbi:hypothetical protein GWK47_024226 [Chionoecetes opilio]|uniref:Uncharacterized protein n=1 Tax=Chionoecetes opilio TaxID=41210 RepID=A0A8J5BTE0_CHIOP|nr:hypothetical protein GWK47_024226 [Chionoecetes opilio]
MVALACVLVLPCSTPREPCRPGREFTLICGSKTSCVCLKPYGSERSSSLPWMLGSCRHYIPKIPSGTEEGQAQAVVEALDQRGITDMVAALSFDTAASNTGIRGGACVLIEQKIGRDLLHFGCRHHVMEIVLAASFKACMGVSSGPDVLLFKKFQAGWEFIDRGTCESGMTADVVRPRISAES